MKSNENKTGKGEEKMSKVELKVVGSNSKNLRKELKETKTNKNSMQIQLQTPVEPAQPTQPTVKPLKKPMENKGGKFKPYDMNSEELLSRILPKHPKHVYGAIKEHLDNAVEAVSSVISVSTAGQHNQHVTIENFASCTYKESDVKQLFPPKFQVHFP